MIIQGINEDEYVSCVNQGITSLHYAEEYSNDKYFYCLMNHTEKAVVAICKNKDGLMPVVKECDSHIYVGYGHCIDIIKKETFLQHNHHVFDSLVYDLLVVPGRVIAILELDAVLFDASGGIAKIHQLSDIVTSYRVQYDQVQIATADGKERIINIGP